MEDEITRQRDILYDESAGFVWPAISIKEIKWKDGDFEIEPGERDKIPFEFIIWNQPDVINIITYLSNPYKQRKQHDTGIGWNYSTIINLRKAREWCGS